ncbi:uncharacterized protein LOC132067594 isoform X2 [Lycium ferocissimum]|uniref:uncharacterized protein LOC132067594 isoform X2 n=1 Tax=Lycium ferocissimum TaxID=112874 RepID=UPI0028155BCA|nr:uncharacterized protein LOC132067594 isoform X2 [Lycium ferocissimum]
MSNRSLLKKLQNPLVRHCFRQGSQVAHLLAQEVMKLAIYNTLATMDNPSTTISEAVQADWEGTTTTKTFPVYWCNKLSSFGNVCVMAAATNNNNNNSAATNSANAHATSSEVT